MSAGAARKRRKLATESATMRQARAVLSSIPGIAVHRSRNSTLDALRNKSARELRAYREAFAYVHWSEKITEDEIRTRMLVDEAVEDRERVATRCVKLLRMLGYRDMADQVAKEEMLP